MKKLSFACICLGLSLFGASVASIDIGGVYRETGKGRLLVVREIGAGIHSFDLYSSVDNPISLGAMHRLPDGSYSVSAEKGTLLKFEEGVIVVMNADTGERLPPISKLLGRRGQIEGTYFQENPDTGEALSVTVDTDASGAKDAHLEAWERRGGWCATETSPNRYVVGDRQETRELAFTDGTCELSERGDRHLYVRDESGPVYGGVTEYTPMKAEAIPGLYLDESLKGKLLLEVSEVGGNLLELAVFSASDRDEFGSGRPVDTKGARVVETQAIRFVFGDSQVQLIDTTDSTQFTFKKVSATHGDAGLYFYSDSSAGFAVMLKVTESDGEYTMVGDSYELEFISDNRGNPDEVYLIRGVDDEAAVAFGQAAVRLITGGNRSTLKKQFALPSAAAAAVTTGVVPNLSKSTSLETLYESLFPGHAPISAGKSASSFASSDWNIREVNVDGFEPVSISPNGTYLFGFLDGAVSVYDLSHKRFVYSEKERRSIDPSSLRWAPDESRLAFTEAFGRTLHDPDLHLIDLLSGRQKTITEDNVERFNISRPEGWIDLTPVWLEDGKTLIYQRTTAHRVHNRSLPISQLMSIETETGKTQAITGGLGNRSTILNLHFDYLSGRVYYSRAPSRSGDPEAGVWVLDPQAKKPIQIHPSSADRGFNLLTGLSLDGKWLMLYYPRLQTGTGGPVARQAFTLYSRDTGLEYPLVEGSEGITINNAVFSPDGSKVLIVYGTTGESERHLAVRNVSDGETHVLYSIADPTLGVSPRHAGMSGLVGLGWCSDDSIFVCSKAGAGALILRPNNN